MTPPAKKRRLLTEHQKEKMRERRDIPTLYNALDPSQDSTQPPLTEDQLLPDRCVCALADTPFHFVQSGMAKLRLVIQSFCADVDWESFAVKIISQLRQTTKNLHPNKNILR